MFPAGFAPASWNSESQILSLERRELGGAEAPLTLFWAMLD